MYSINDFVNELLTDITDVLLYKQHEITVMEM